MILAGTLLYGINHAIRMYRRRENLKALERILVCLESEIRYRHSVIGEAFLNVAKKADKQFTNWLYYLGERLNSKSINEDDKHSNSVNIIDMYSNGNSHSINKVDMYSNGNSHSISESISFVKKDDTGYNADFFSIWTDSLFLLSSGTCLTKEDLEELCAIGQTLGYLDIEAHKMGLRLEIDSFHKKISDYSEGLKDKIKVSVVTGAVVGILVVIVLT
ncbi:MAG: stage III sporulation protein AB [Lachnospiraceae bacterium]|nr:stage III sporulation protein AB [Lachnospiraceae bacterium]